MTGVGYMTRKAALLITPSMEISLVEGGTKVRFLSVTKVKTFDVTLPLDGKSSLLGQLTYWYTAGTLPVHHWYTTGTCN